MNNLIQPGIIICTFSLVASVILLLNGVPSPDMKMWYYFSGFLVAAYIGGKTFIMRMMDKKGTTNSEIDKHRI